MGEVTCAASPASAAARLACAVVKYGVLSPSAERRMSAALLTLYAAPSAGPITPVELTQAVRALVGERTVVLVEAEPVLRCGIDGRTGVVTTVVGSKQRGFAGTGARSQFQQAIPTLGDHLRQFAVDLAAARHQVDQRQFRRVTLGALHRGGVIADGEHFVHEEDVRVDVDRHGKSQAHVHPGRVELDRCIEKFLDL